jgi:hypothetical protein
MDARDEALAVMGWELAMAHVETAVRCGGVVVWQGDAVAIVAPWAEGGVTCSASDTLAVLYAGGDVRVLAQLAEEQLAYGYRQLLVCRGFRGDDRCRVWGIERFVRLAKQKK